CVWGPGAAFLWLTVMLNEKELSESSVPTTKGGSLDARLLPPCPPESGTTSGTATGPLGAGPGAGPPGAGPGPGPPGPGPGGPGPAGGGRGGPGGAQHGRLSENSRSRVANSLYERMSAPPC